VRHEAVIDTQTDGQTDNHAGTFFCFVKADRPHAHKMSRSFCNQRTFELFYKVFRALFLTRKFLLWFTYGKGKFSAFGTMEVSARSLLSRTHHQVLLG